MFVQKLIRLSKNFYVVTGVILFAWMLGFDANDLGTQFRNWWKLRALETDRVYYEEEIAKIQQQRKEIFGSTHSQEKFARENYLMKKNGEEVYVLVNEKNEPIEK
jgi:cell division protein DivIC